MPKAREVVVTGVGVVSPIGVGCDAFWNSLVARKSGVERVQSFNVDSLPVKIGAEVLDFDPRKFITSRKSLKVMGRDIQLGVSVAQLAIKDADLTPGKLDPPRFGVVFGADLLQDGLHELGSLYRKCIEGEVFDFHDWGQVMEAELFPLFMLKYLPNMTACHITIACDAQGPNNTVTMGAASSLMAIQEAARCIERGLADVMIAGGSGTRMYPLKYVQSVLGEPLSRRNDDPAQACRPFELDRDGFVNGEGAGAVVLESREHAEARGARIDARLVGRGSAFEPRMKGRPRQGRAVRIVIADALREAGWNPSDVGHVNADGWGVPDFDRAEATAIRDLLGDAPVLAPKSYFGYLGAGTGAVEMAASLLAFRQGVLPTTLNYDSPDPTCPVNVVTEPLEGEPLKSALLLNQSRVGQAASLLIERVD